MTHSVPHGGRIAKPDGKHSFSFAAAKKCDGSRNAVRGFLEQSIVRQRVALQKQGMVSALSARAALAKGRGRDKAEPSDGWGQLFLPDLDPFLRALRRLERQFLKKIHKVIVR